MKKIKREKQMIENYRDYVRYSIDNGIDRTYVMIDRRDGYVVLMESKSRSKNYIYLGSVKLKDVRPTIKNVNAIATQVRKLVQAYERKSFICYSKAVSEYGKSNVIDKAFVIEVDNPHYKCAWPMRLYDSNVIEFYMK